MQGCCYNADSDSVDLGGTWNLHFSQAFIVCCCSVDYTDGVPRT